MTATIIEDAGRTVLVIEDGESTLAALRAWELAHDSGNLPVVVCRSDFENGRIFRLLERSASAQREINGLIEAAGAALRRRDLATARRLIEDATDIHTRIGVYLGALEKMARDLR